MRRLLPILLAVALAAIAPPAPHALAQSGESLTLLAHLDFGSLPNTDVAVADGYAYVGTYYSASAGRVFITDVRDPAAPRLAHTYFTSRGQAVLDLQVKDGIAMFALSGGLDIVDVRNPEAPVLLAHYREGITHGVHDVFMDGRYAYLVDDGGPGGMHIIDYGDPARPREVAFHSPAGHSHDMTVVGDVCYLANLEGGFEILDVSDRGRPRVVAHQSYAGAFTHNIWPTEDGRYVVTTDEICGTGRLRVWDVSNLAAIRQVGTFGVRGQTSTIHNAQVVGRHVFMSYYTHGLQVASIESPAAPRAAGSFQTFGGAGSLSDCFAGAWGVAAVPAGDGSVLVYVSDIETGLWVFRFRSTATEEPGPKLDLTTKLEGRQLVAGERVALGWETIDGGGVTSQRVELSLDDGRTFAPLASSVPTGQFTFDWTVPAVDTPSARLRVTVSDGLNPPVSEVSGRFTISSTANRTPYAAVAFPAGGEMLAAGAIATVAWTAIDDSSLTTRVELSTDGGSSYAEVAVSSETEGRGTWVVPNVPTSRARMRVVVADGAHEDVVATSSDFTIAGDGAVDATPPRAVLFAPVTGERVGAGAEAPVVFEAMDDVRAGRAIFELSVDRGRSYQVIGSTVAAGIAKHEVYGLPLSDLLDRGRALLRVVSVDAAGNAAVSEPAQLDVLPLPSIAAVRAKAKGSDLRFTFNGSEFTVGETVFIVDAVELARTKFPQDARDGRGGASRAVATAGGLAASLPPGASMRVTAVNPSTGQRSAEVLFTRQ